MLHSVNGHFTLDCLGRPLVCLQGETAFNVALRAAEQVSADFLTLPDSKVFLTGYYKGVALNPTGIHTQFRGLEAKSRGAASLLSSICFFLSTVLLSFFHYPLSSLEDMLC